MLISPFEAYYLPCSANMSIKNNHLSISLSINHHQFKPLMLLFCDKSHINLVNGHKSVFWGKFETLPKNAAFITGTTVRKSIYICHAPQKD
jgi:hypothetical protein